MLSIEPRLRIIDISHDVEPYSILDGARFLAGTAPYYPPRTVFVAVIDPGVGSKRRALVVKSKRGQFFVLPDNGLITLVERLDGIEEVRQITNPAWFHASTLSSTFHGRDVFAPAGAHLARGDLDWKEVGPRVTDPVRLDIPESRLTEKELQGAVLSIERPYGNLITNIEAEQLAKAGYELGERVAVALGRRKLVLPFVATFSDVPAGAPLMYVDSRGRLGFAINLGDFAKAYQVKPPLALKIPRKGRARP